MIKFIVQRFPSASSRNVYNKRHVSIILCRFYFMIYKFNSFINEFLSTLKQKIWASCKKLSRTVSLGSLSFDFSVFSCKGTHSWLNITNNGGDLIVLKLSWRRVMRLIQASLGNALSPENHLRCADAQFFFIRDAGMVIWLSYLKIESLLLALVIQGPR